MKNNPFLDVLRRLGENGHAERDREVSEALEETCRRVAYLLSFCDTRVRQDLLTLFSASVEGLLPEDRSSLPEGQPIFTPLTPELLEWARQSFSEEEIVAGLRDIEETGGLELKDFIHELVQEVSSDE